MAKANRVGVIKLPKAPFESKESRKARRELERKIKTICMWPSVKVEIRISPQGVSTVAVVLMSESVSGWNCPVSALGSSSSMQQMSVCPSKARRLAHLTDHLRRLRLSSVGPGLRWCSRIRIREHFSDGRSPVVRPQSRVRRASSASLMIGSGSH